MPLRHRGGRCRGVILQTPSGAVLASLIVNPGITQMDSGIPESSREATVRFRYNDLESLAAVLAAADVACVILEAATATAEPEPGFLQGVRRLCDQHGSLLIIDEMITGFRWSAHGAQAVYDVRPDLSCWGKAMGNGFPVSALAGKRVGANELALERFTVWAATSHDDWIDALGEAIDSSADARAARGTPGHGRRTHALLLDAWAAIWRKAVLS